jgi:DNA-binding CsgD family transcriptional regulator
MTAEALSALTMTARTYFPEERHLHLAALERLDNIAATSNDEYIAQTAAEDRAWQAWLDGDFDQTIEAFRRLAAAETNDLSSLIYFESVIAELLVATGRFSEGLQTANETLALTPHPEVHTLWGHLIAVSSYACYWTGEWDEAERLRTSILDAPGSFFGRLTLLRDQAMVAVRRGELQDAQETLQQMQEQAPEPHSPGVDVTQWSKPLVITAHIAEMCADYRTARAALKEVMLEPALVHSSAHMWVAVLAASRLTWRQPMDEGWTALVERAAEPLHRNSPVGRAWFAEVSANLARAAGNDDPSLWQVAVNAWDKIGAAYELAWCRLRLVESLLPEPPKHAAAELNAALVAADLLGAKPLSNEIIGLAAKARLRLPEAPSPQNGPLTSRERQVLQLVAEGMTNQQLGQALFMSPKTASVHVSRILHKLGATNRAEAVTIAFRAGLLIDPSSTSQLQPRRHPL